MTAVLVSVDSGVFPPVGVGAIAVSNKSTWVFLLNAAYALLLIIIRPYKSVLFLMFDLGVTSLFVLAALNNLASNDDQTRVYLLAISGWGLAGLMAFAFYSQRKLRKKKWRKDGLGKEKVRQSEGRRLERSDSKNSMQPTHITNNLSLPYQGWLSRLEPYDGQQLHPTSRKLLDRFITLCTMCEVVCAEESFDDGRRLHCELTVVQANLLQSLGKGSGLRDFISKQFATNEDKLKKVLSSAIDFYKNSLHDLQHESDIHNFEQYIRRCLKVYDYSLAFERTLRLVKEASEEVHDYGITRDCTNELTLFVDNTNDRKVEKWKDNVFDIISKFEVGR